MDATYKKSGFMLGRRPLHRQIKAPSLRTLIDVAALSQTDTLERASPSYRR